MSKLNKIIFAILITIIIILLFFMTFDYIRDKEYQEEYDYLNTHIIIKIKTNSFKKKKIFTELHNILYKYDKLTSTKQEDDELINLYKIHHNFLKQDTLTINADLYDLIKYGITLYDKTDGLIDISKGNIIDIWDSYLTTKTGIPTAEELNLANSQKIDDIILLENNQIKNNKVNINLDNIIKGYVIDKIKIYLETSNITSYSINIDMVVAVGSDKTYKIGLKNPDDDTSILKIIEEKNKVVAQTTYANKKYDYNKKRYHSLINPKTLYPDNYFKSVWVIAEKASDAELLSNILFMMDIEKGREYIKDMQNIKVIWLTLNDEIITN